MDYRLISNRWAFRVLKGRAWQLMSPVCIHIFGMSLFANIAQAFCSLMYIYVHSCLYSFTMNVGYLDFVWYTCISRYNSFYVVVRGLLLISTECDVERVQLADRSYALPSSTSELNAIW